MYRHGSDEPVPMLTIYLDAEASGNLLVRSISTHQSGTRLRVSFDRRTRLDEAFHQGFANELTSITARLSGDVDVLSLPDYQFLFGGISLGGVRAFRSAGRVRSRHVQVRFMYYLGAIDALIRTSLPFQGAILGHRERIAVETLADITAPMLGLAECGATDRLRQDGMVAERLGILADRSREIQFFMSLLTRHVRQCADERSASIEHDPAPGGYKLPT